MSAGALIMMLLVCTVTFGGFIGIMALAISRETRRRGSQTARTDRPRS